MQIVERVARADEFLQTMSWDKVHESMSELIDEVIVNAERGMRNSEFGVAGSSAMSFADGAGGI